MNYIKDIGKKIKVSVSVLKIDENGVYIFGIKIKDLKKKKEKT